MPSSSDVRTDLLKAATRLIAERGFAGSSIQEVAEQVGVTKQALLYHFKSKDALRFAVIDEILERANVEFMRMLGSLEGPSRVEAIIEHLRRYLEEQAQGATVILRFLIDRDEAAIDRIKSTARPWFQLLEGELEKAQHKGQVRKNLDPEAALLQIGMLVLTNFALFPLEYWTRRPPPGWRRRRLEALVTAVEHVLFPDGKLHGR